MKTSLPNDISQLASPGVSRRVALRTLAAGLGTTVAVPAAAADGLGHAHPAGAGETAEQQPATLFVRSFFDAHQFATVQVLAGLILPGAESSGTPEFFDKVLVVESVDTRRRVVSALGAFDGAAMRAHGRAFKDVTAVHQTAILTQASTMPPGSTTAVWRPGDPIGPPPAPPEPANLRDHFDYLKGWVADLHFTSEAGLRELGWTGAQFFERFNGCATQP